MRMKKILNKVSAFLLTLQKLTHLWVWIGTEDVRSEELEMILPMKELTDEGNLKALRRIGFDGRVFVEKKTTGLSFVGDDWFMCERQWKVKVDIEDIGEAYLCREHLDHEKNVWKKSLKITRQRQTRLVR